MAQRGRYGFVNAANPEAAGVCDRGGEVRRRSELRAEMRWSGDRLIPTGLLCCAQHMDRPNPQDRTLRLRADAVPIRDPRPMPTFTFGPAIGVPNPAAPVRLPDPVIVPPVIITPPVVVTPPVTPTPTSALLGSTFTLGTSRLGA